MCEHVRILTYNILLSLISVPWTFCLCFVYMEHVRLAHIASPVCPSLSTVCLCFVYILTFHLNRRKKEAREVHEKSAKAQRLHGLKAKLYNKKRHAEKVQMKKTYVSYIYRLWLLDLIIIM